MYRRINSVNVALKHNSSKLPLILHVCETAVNFCPDIPKEPTPPVLPNYSKKGLIRRFNIHCIGIIASICM